MATEPPLRIEGVEVAPSGVEIEDLKAKHGTVAMTSDLGVLGIGSKRDVGLEDETVSLMQSRIVSGREELVAKEGLAGKKSGKDLANEKSSYAEAVNVGSGSNISPVFEIVDGVADIEIPTEIFEDVEPLWNSFVVGYFMGDSPYIGTIHSTVNRIWSTPKAKIDVQFINKRTVLFRIEDEQMRKRQVVLKLMGELERVNVSQYKSGEAGCSYAQAEENSTTKAGEEGLTMEHTGTSVNGEPLSPVSNGSKMAVNGVESPNGFQVLSDIREEGEIEEEEEEDAEEDENVRQETNGKEEIVNQEADTKTRDAHALHSQANSQRGKGKNNKKPMISNKSFIQAVKSTSNKKVSSRRK
ncbi:hypothetical protein HID58_015169 [Brassica napus]|uniref:DUF4283 domain-containing protein n=1 Tax=Brassica napus TaxID=3708 RepID=A0ABQ8DJ81_BRANA|nr:hypothetical protein HID58_015169 [Brassica napus]